MHFGTDSPLRPRIGARRPWRPAGCTGGGGRGGRASWNPGLRLRPGALCFCSCPGTRPRSEPLSPSPLPSSHPVPCRTPPLSSMRPGGGTQRERVHCAPGPGLGTNTSLGAQADLHGDIISATCTRRLRPEVGKLGRGRCMIPDHMV